MLHLAEMIQVKMTNDSGFSVMTRLLCWLKQDSSVDYGIGS